MASTPLNPLGQIAAGKSLAGAIGAARGPCSSVRLASMAVAVVWCMQSAPAHANEREGPYVAAAVTGSKLQKPKQTIANAPSPGSTLQVVNDVNFGWGGQVEVGYAFKALRVEAEIGRTSNHSDSYSAISPIAITIPQRGKNTTTRYMGNVFFDIPVRDLPLRPFIGGGIGAARSYVSTFAAPARAPNAPPSQLIAFSETRFAYQLMGGVSVPLSSRTELTAQYRWLDSGTVHGLDARGQRATRTLRGSNIDVGLRFSF